MSTLNIEKYRAMVSKDSNTMKSTDLHKFVYEATGKYKDKRDFHKKLKVSLFGTEAPTKTEISEGADFAPTLRGNGQIEYFNLTEVECNMIMASIDTKHLRLMAQVFVAVKNEIEKNSVPKTYIQALEALIESEREKEAALLENKLKDEAIEKNEKVISDIVHAGNTYTATEVAKSIGVSGHFFNKVLLAAKVLRRIGNGYVLTSKYQGHNLAEIKEYAPNDDGKTFTSLKWTAIGKQWIENQWSKALIRSGLELPKSSSKEIKNLPNIPKKRK